MCTVYRTGSICGVCLKVNAYISNIENVIQSLTECGDVEEKMQYILHEIY